MTTVETEIEEFIERYANCRQLPIEVARKHKIVDETAKYYRKRYSEKNYAKETINTYDDIVDDKAC